MSDREGLLVLFKGPAEAEVIRVKLDAVGAWVEESHHTVKDGACDCEGFRYRHQCAHLASVSEPVVGRPVSLDEARRLIASLRETMGRDASLPDEPFERDAEGRIVGVHLNVSSHSTGYYEGAVDGVKVHLALVSPRR